MNPAGRRWSSEDMSVAVVVFESSVPRMMAMPIVPQPSTQIVGFWRGIVSCVSVCVCRCLGARWGMRAWIRECKRRERNQRKTPTDGIVTHSSSKSESLGHFPVTVLFYTEHSLSFSLAHRTQKPTFTRSVWSWDFGDSLSLCFCLCLCPSIHPSIHPAIHYLRVNTRSSLSLELWVSSPFLPLHFLLRPYFPTLCVASLAVPISTLIIISPPSLISTRSTRTLFLLPLDFFIIFSLSLHSDSVPPLPSFLPSLLSCPVLPHCACQIALSTVFTPSSHTD